MARTGTFAACLAWPLLLACGCGRPVGGLPPDPPPGCAQRVVFVVIDALRRDHLGVYGAERPISPNIDRLAREGLFLSNVTSSSSHTVPAMLTLVSSLLPSEHGIQYWSGTHSFTPDRENVFPRLADEITTVAEYFAAAGYYTAGIVANPWLSKAHGFAQGFAEYVEFMSRDGAHINREAERILGQHPDERTFLYLHYLDVHNPYSGTSRGPLPFEIPEEGQLQYRNGLAPDLSPADLEKTRAHYDARIYYMDGHLGELMQFAEGAGLNCDTTWVITSDHGDEFHEHGGLGHGTTLYNELVNVFAIFWNPHRFGVGRVDRGVHARDVLPTLLRGQDIPIPDVIGGVSLYTAPGHIPPPAPVTGLVSELADRKAISEGEWKLILDLEDGTERLYRVGIDGAIEGRPETDPDTELLARLRQQLDAVLHEPPRARLTPIPIDSETERRLRELGYLGDVEAAP